MKNLISLIRLSIALFLFILITGCGSNVVQNPNISIDNSSGRGFVAFSAMCDGVPEMTMIYNEADFDPARILLEDDQNTEVNIPCYSHTPQYYLLKLPAGKYNVNGFMTGNLITKNFDSIPFKVQAGTVIYIGRIYVSGIYDTHTHLHYTGRTIVNAGQDTYLDKYKVIIMDKSTQDIPYLLQKYKNISREYYTIQVPGTNNNTAAKLNSELATDLYIANIKKVPITIGNKKA